MEPITLSLLLMPLLLPLDVYETTHKINQALRWPLILSIPEFTLLSLASQLQNQTSFPKEVQLLTQNPMSISPADKLGVRLKLSLSQRACFVII
jgi:hypothetical protein